MPSFSRTLPVVLALLVTYLSCLAHAQSGNTCNNDTIWNVMLQDPDMSIVAIGTQNSNADIFLNSPEVNATVFVPTNIATVRGMYDYAGIIDYEKNYFGSGLTILPLVYGVLEGQISPENLTSVPSMNSVMGMVNSTDFTIKMSENSTQEDYYIVGIAPNNIAKVLNVTKACNGYVYKVDTLLLPAPLATPVPNRLDFGQQLIDIFYKGNCPVPLQNYVEQNVPLSKEWLGVWNATQMMNPMSDPALSATIFVPQDKGVLAAGNAATTADAVMYNMLRGDWCPEELLAAGTKNSMLGDVLGQKFPLTFSNDIETGNLIITGSLGSARVLNVTLACNNLVYITDVPLLPPPQPASAGGGASAAPSSLPISSSRHVTCNPPIFSENIIETPDPTKNPAIALEEAARQAANSADAATNNAASNTTTDINDNNNNTSSSSSTTALAIGLGVGIGCAVLLGGAAGFALAKRRRKNNTISNKEDSNNLLTPTSSSDLGTGAKLLPGQSIVGASVLSNANSTKRAYSGQYRGSSAPGGDGTGSTATFASVSDIFCDSAFTPGKASSTTTSNNNTATNEILANINNATDTGGAAAAAAPATAETVGGGNANSNTNRTDVDLWEVKHTDLQIALDSTGQPVELGKGSYGTVYRGTIRQVQPAAIKVLNEDLGIDASAAFWKEAAILKHASRDRNVVQLYGTSILPDGKFLLITELMEQGDLRKALVTKGVAEELVWSRKGKSISLDIARGVTALHAVNVIHRDLKSKNVLLTENFTAKVGDMGIAGVHSQGYLTAGAGQAFGTLAWSAPEMLLGERCSEKVDIYSLGIVLWEIATKGGVPQRGLVQPPPPSNECPAELSALIKECINPDPSSRPNAKQVYERLLQIPQSKEG